MIRRTTLALSPVVLACLMGTDAMAAQRTFVSATGADTNPCTIALPCRSFAYALTLTDSGGEIVALNAAGYGAVAIDKSVTITTNSGFFAGIAASTGSAISVIAPGLNIVLRGLALNGIGATTGIAMSDAGTLTVENCIVSGFTGNGISVTAPATVRIVDTIVRGNGTTAGDGIFVSGGSTASLNNVKMSRNQRAGLAVNDNGAGTSTVSVVNSDSTANEYGFLAHRTSTGTARVAILRSSAAGNSGAAVGVIGVQAQAAVSFSHLSSNNLAYYNEADMGLLETYSNNVVRYNDNLNLGAVTPAVGQ